MYRLIGFLTGVIVTLLVLVAVVDHPTRERVQLLSADIAETVLDAVDRILPGDSPTPGAGPPVPLADPGPDPRVTLERGPPLEESMSAPSLAAGEAFELGGWLEKDGTNSVQHHVPKENLESGRDTVAWQPIWTAFHSELSARGFADRLEHLTGREYRVSRTSPWSYQVEVAYADEAQREVLLLEIQSRTGLTLTGENP